jgi:hypothetical protein
MRFGLVLSMVAMTATTVVETSYAQSASPAPILSPSTPSVLTVPNPSTPITGAELVPIKVAILDQLIDPNSALFTHVFATRMAKAVVVCGLVNSKNRLGGYVGAMPFVALGTSINLFSPGEDQDAFLKYWKMTCYAGPLTVLPNF